MCGVPHYSIAGPIGKLLAAGFKVAICDQVEPVSQAKGLVKRAVTRVLTPGMVYDPESLDQLTANYLCAFDNHSLSFTDTSTGEAFYYLISDEKTKWRLMNILNPVELILTAEQKESYFTKKEIKKFHISVFEEVQNNEIVEKLPSSAVRLRSYIKAQQGEETLKIIRPFQRKSIEQEMRFSDQAQEHLELFKTYDGNKQGSLFTAVNRTKTPAGARLLKNRLRNPSTNKQELENRLDSVEQWITQLEKIKQIRNLLVHVGDMERKLGKISNPQCNGRDLLSLAESLKCSLEIVPQDRSRSVSYDVLNSINWFSKRSLFYYSFGCTGKYSKWQYDSKRCFR